MYKRQSKLKPAFKKDGTVTAGNAPGTNDGAAALIVSSGRIANKLGKKPMARIVAQAVSGVEPKWVMMAPVEAVEKLLQKTGWDRDKDLDLVELNEAFSVAAIDVYKRQRPRSRLRRGGRLCRRFQRVVNRLSLFLPRALD